MPASTVDAVLGIIGSQSISVQIDAKATTPQRTVDTLKKIHPNTSFGISNADIFSTSFMPAVAEAIGEKNAP